MKVFDAMINTIYDDPNMQVAASYYSPVRDAVAVPVRLIQYQRDEDVAAGDKLLRIPTVIFEVRKAQLAAPELNGKIVVTNGASFIIKSKPEQTDDGRSWILSVRPL